MFRIAPVVVSLSLLACVSAQRTEEAPAPPPCGDLAAWRARALASSTGATLASLERWQPGAAVAAADRPAVGAVAREHLDACGLEEVVALTSRLVPFRTVSEHRDAGTDPEFREMGAFLREWAEHHGMTFTAHGDDDVWELSLGEGPAGIGFVMHGDVVPASGEATPLASSTDGGTPPLPAGWTQPPWEATRVGELLFGRGTEDDKGPIAAVLVVMDTLRRFDLLPATRMVAIIGNGEESDWEPMKAYAKAVPPPRFTISVDASFPLVIAESGFVEWHLLAPLERAQGRPCPEVVDVRGGEFLTQIPGEAAMTLRPGASQRAAELLARATALAREEQQTRGAPFRAEAKAAGELVIVRTFGASGHSSVPEESANALWPLSRIASRLDVCAGGAGTLLRLIAAELDGDHFGERLKLGYADPLLGRLVQAPTVLRLEQGAARLELNLRRPGGMSHEAFEQRLDQVTAALGEEYGVREDVAKRHLGDPHVAELEGPLVSTLLDVYRREKGDPAARPTVIRGGTYGRLFPGAVSFGPGLPGAPYRGHAADEAIELSTLRFQAQVLFEAALRLDPLTPER